MKNKKMMFGLVFSLLLLSSCKNIKNTVTMSELKGEWNIVEVNRQEVSANPLPFIGFDTEEKRIYGNSGRNRIMGGFRLSNKNDKIELEEIAGTMMACPDMELETNVLKALSEASRIRHGDEEDEIILSDKSGNPVILLKKKTHE